jgi:hypothetical protein
MIETNELAEQTVMPFVLCRSNGGPHDDTAFMSGWRLGEIAAVLAQPGISAMADAIRADERQQADLLAMAYGYAMSVDASSSDGWLSVTFTRTSP